MVLERIQAVLCMTNRSCGVIFVFEAKTVCLSVLRLLMSFLIRIKHFSSTFAKQRGRMTGLGWSRSRSKSSIKRYETRVKLICYEEGIFFTLFQHSISVQGKEFKRSGPIFGQALGFCPHLGYRGLQDEPSFLL